ncbi:MAG TPA: DUF177 domain-containing protein [Vicinamibacterales bacterium]|nr:DUF177 domain-containing protein [Vicinamibacterales bacterium]
MFLDLSQFREPRTHVERTFEPDEGGVVHGLTPEGEREAFGVMEPVRLSFDLLKDGKNYRLAGRVATRLSLDCSRCLEPFEFPVDGTFDLLYVPHAENAAPGEEIEVEEDDLGTAYYRDERIDLGQLLREQFYLAIPMKPLCRESCRGLCPQCGTNLNTGTCACTNSWTDPRLEGLRALANRRDGEA